jgi:hypothetical protein
MSENNTPAPNANPTPNANPAPAAAPAPADWTSSFNDDLKGYVQNKGFKDPSAVLDSYRNLEKLVGVPADRVLKLPQDMEDPQALNEIYSKLGRPQSPTEYKLGDGKSEDSEFQKWARGTFHELGLNRKQAETLAAKYDQFLSGLATQSEEKQIQENKLQEDSLKKKWGAAYDQNLGLAKRTAREFGIDGETIDKVESAVGFTKLMELFSNIGQKLGEASFETGSGDGPGNSFNGMLIS